jgi:hypothetical protein
LIVLASDRRQLRRILQTIAAARAGYAPLVNVADELLFLRDALKEVDRSWADEFTSHVASLESMGLATTEQRIEMGETYEEIVDETLNALEHLVARLGLTPADINSVDEDDCE